MCVCGVSDLIKLLETYKLSELCLSKILANGNRQNYKLGMKMIL